MNKLNVIELVKNLISAKNEINQNEQSLSDITINLQNANKTDIVFYKVKDSASVDIFKKRLKESNAGLVFVNFDFAKDIKDPNCLFIEEENFLKVQKILLDSLFPNNEKLKIVGITGTNGKTTTVNLAMQISSYLGHRAFSVGTIGVFDCNGEIYPDFGTTTPSYIELRKIINKFQDSYEACFVEVSSHALVQNRFNDLRLDISAWMSFSQDHLDYHQSMTEYFKSKMIMEKNLLKENSFVVIPKREELLKDLILKENPNSKLKFAKTLEERNIQTDLLFYKSKYNQSNIEVAIELNEYLWGNTKISNLNLNKIKQPNGRFSVIDIGDGSMVIIDYAHTPDALTNIGNALKEAFPKHKITVVFGCGGNRDKTKRPLMAKAVSAFADKMIITSDNPRNEAPESIVWDIIKDAQFGYEAIIDREKAIIAAMEECEENEIILIAGKGHEEYQEINGVKHPFSDFKIVDNYIEENS